MAIDEWFQDAEEISSLAIARILECEAKGVPKNKRYYLREFDEKYHLTQRIENQIAAYRRGEIKSDKLTSNVYLAEILAVERSTISRYLRTKLSPSDFQERQKLLRQAGSSREGKNGDKTKNFKSSGNP